MPKPTDGRSWLPKREKEIVTRYRDAHEKYILEGEYNSGTGMYHEATADYLNASKQLCSLVADQYNEIRSLRQKLGWAKRRGFGPP